MKHEFHCKHLQSNCVTVHAFTGSGFTENQPALRCKALRAGGGLARQNYGGQVKYLLAYEQARPKKDNPER